MFFQKPSHGRVISLFKVREKAKERERGEVVGKKDIFA